MRREQPKRLVYIQVGRQLALMSCHFRILWLAGTSQSIVLASPAPGFPAVGRTTNISVLDTRRRQWSESLRKELLNATARELAWALSLTLESPGKEKDKHTKRMFHLFYTSIRSKKKKKIKTTTTKCSS